MRSEQLSSAIMSDDSDMSDNDQPPALEDADIDDVSSNASVVTESSDSVSIETDDESSIEEGDDDDKMEEDDDHDESSNDSCNHFRKKQSSEDENVDALGTAFIVPLKTGSDDESANDDRVLASPKGRIRRRKSEEEKGEALERNSMRRQASNDMLAAMQAAARAAAPPPQRTDSSGSFKRQAPARAKSSDGMTGEDASGDAETPRRRPPARTKSGDGLGSDAPPRRRAPARTKSGDGLATPAGMPARRVPDQSQLVADAAGDSGDFVVALQGDSDGDDEILMSPSGRKRRTRRERDVALERNGVRRQASSDMLGAMRDAARRSAPARAKSSGAALTGRRPPARTKSGDGLEGVKEVEDENKRPAPRRRPPARTKSGDGLEAVQPEPRRRPPARTKSGDGFASPAPARRKPPARTKSGDMLSIALLEE